MSILVGAVVKNTVDSSLVAKAMHSSVEKFMKVHGVNYETGYFSTFIGSHKFLLLLASSDKSIQMDFIKKLGSTEKGIIAVTGLIYSIGSEAAFTKNKYEIAKKIMDLYGSSDLTFPKYLDGVYAAIIATERELILVTDSTSSKTLYYYYSPDNSFLVFSSSYPVLLRLLNSIGIRLALDIKGAYFLLSFGYMIGDTTLEINTKKIPPGSLLYYSPVNGAMKIVKYDVLDNSPLYSLDEETIIDELHRRFLRAVVQEFLYDAIHGRRHIVTLSGGLDSRTTTFYAYSAGFHDMTAICFSQRNYVDHIVSRTISSDLGIRYIFVPLDPGDFIVRVYDKVIEASGGLSVFLGHAHAYYTMSMLLRHSSILEKHGILHTGQLGDAIFGTYLSGLSHEPLSISTISRYAISRKLLKKAIKFINISAYKNAEIFGLYERGFNGILSGYKAIEPFTGYSSPFLHRKFIEFVLKIRPEYRYEEYIYIKWLQKYQPRELRYTWEKLGFKPYYCNKTLLKILKNINRVRHIVYRDILKIAEKADMNPFDIWFRSNSTLRSFFDKLYRQHVEKLVEEPLLRDDIKYLYTCGNVIEKSMVLTLMLAIDRFALSFH